MIPPRQSSDLPTTARPSDETNTKNETSESVNEPLPGSSQILCIESCFPPSREKDCMYDGIIDYLRTRTYPPFLKLTSNRQLAKMEFRKKCEPFFLDKHGELVEGRAKGLERHVLRRGELACVMKFIHEVLGHCSADVCVKVAQPVVWSSEPFDITAYSVIKRCECRDKNGNVRWFPCPVDYAKHIMLMFVRKANGGYLLNIRSLSDEVDLGRFQLTVPRCMKGKTVAPKHPEILIDGRYRINDRQELEDVLDKLHLAFGHCGPNHLRILFKSRFHYPCFFVAAREICSRCWFCKLEPHRKHFVINDYGYDIEVKPPKEDLPRNFIIYPRDVTTKEVAKYINETLEKSRKNLGLEAAAVIANGAGLGSPPSKKPCTGFDASMPSCRTVGSGPPNFFFRYKRNVITNCQPQCPPPQRPRLIPPSEISLGPTTTAEGSDTDSSMSRNSSHMSNFGDINHNTVYANSLQSNQSFSRNSSVAPIGLKYQNQLQPARGTYAKSATLWDVPMNAAPTSYVDNSYYIARDADGGEYTCELNNTCMPLVEPENYTPNSESQGNLISVSFFLNLRKIKNIYLIHTTLLCLLYHLGMHSIPCIVRKFLYLSRMILFVNDDFYEDISDLQPTSSQCVPYLMDYNADFTCEPIPSNLPAIVENSFSDNIYSNSGGTLEDLGDLSSFFGNLDSTSVWQ